MTQIEEARSLAGQAGIDLLLVSPSADLVYLTGYAGHASERPTLLAIPQEGPARILMPQLEAPRFPASAGIDVVAYDETEDPYRRLDDALGGKAPGTAAVADQTWSSVLLRLQALWPGTRFRSATATVRELRMRKSDDEIEVLAQAGRIDDEVFNALLATDVIGQTERQVSDELQRLLRDRGMTDVWAIVASGPNSASPHHFSGERRIGSGDALVLDFGGALDSYQADITRTVHVGPPDDAYVRVYEVVRQAQEAAVRAAGPGVPAEEVDRAARGVIDAAGYGDFFIHRTGHGIGLEVHEEPYIVSGNTLILEAGMTFSVEPGVYLPGKFGVRIEDIVAITADGARRLNEAPRELIAVD
jgi:Xaa-Pro aminopeptidase